MKGTKLIQKFKKILVRTLYYYYTIVKPKFVFENKKYNYFCREYNLTWTDERAVEIPIILDMIKEYKNKKFLEIGNVLSHYFKFNIDVVDKYEKADSVINKDIINFKSKEKYDLILSISTFQHIGWDETLFQSGTLDKNKYDPLKILKVIKHLKKNCLTPGGKIILTFPFGYNPYLDKLIKNKDLPFKECYYLKRISILNKWKQVKWEDIENIGYNFKSYRANAIIIGLLI